MFTVVPPQAIDLSAQPFVAHSVQFNLFHRILQAKEVLALEWREGATVRSIAAGNPGHALWLWVDSDLEPSQSALLLADLAQQLQSERLTGVSAEPALAETFADRYAALVGAISQPVMRMEAYHCPEVFPPQGVGGQMIAPTPEHRELVAEFCAGFIYWGYGEAVSQESQLPGADRLIKSGDLLLWAVDGQVVCMANIAHRSEHHARINSVYTPPEQRGRGFASALVAAISQNLLTAGLTPMLYADLKNATSNKIYRNIGYRQCGEIAEHRFRYPS